MIYQDDGCVHILLAKAGMEPVLRCNDGRFRHYASLHSGGFYDETSYLTQTRN